MFKNIEGNLEDEEDSVPAESAPGRCGEDKDDGWGLPDQAARRMRPADYDREFKRLYDGAFQVLFRVAFRITNNREAAEDLCQEGFFRLYEKNMVFPNMEEAKYWLIRVVKNASLNYAKRKERERKAYQKAFKEDQRQEETGEGLLVKKETSEEVQAALNKLPENLRIVLVLKEYAEMNYKEIGRVLGISEGNVKVRVYRARERLTALLAGKMADIQNTDMVHTNEQIQDRGETYVS